MLELVVDPFGKVAHAAVYTADDGSVFCRVFVHFQHPVTLRGAPGFCEAALKVRPLILSENFFVGLYQEFELVFSSVHTAFC